MGFGLPLRGPVEPEVSTAPTLTYRATNGDEVQVDEQAPTAARERAIARGLLLHALSLIDAADRPH
ncbi:hypothetical protein [Actinacidiphila epipremni]|uniref:Uncharacterized protein n=1 Tax=Actinacidiphila epipremni TaxID=2053013 RepID=A0ABX0ZF22_9ACTN|nr:hypothetical protein [Actinacidiphila epipremni]NJP42295.1 hypothetical protein [Actinacidiphila epipremni]